MNVIRTWAKILAASAVVLALASCRPAEPTSNPGTIPPEMFQNQWAAPEVPVAHILRRDYRIREGDHLVSVAKVMAGDPDQQAELDFANGTGEPAEPADEPNEQ